MASDLYKPLPDIPNLPQKELAVESRDHLRRFLDAALAQEKLPSWPDGAPPAWGDALEGALRELVNAICDGDWITGIKLAKEQTRRRTRERERERTKSAASSRGSGEQERDGGRGKKAGDTVKQTKNSTENVDDGSSLHNPAQRDLLALQQLRAFASKPANLSPSTDPILQHLLLTVVLFDEHPPKSPVLDATRANPRCVFVPNKFSLPKPDLFGEDPAGNEEVAAHAALYGFKEWIVDEKARPDPLRLVGGSFSFHARLFPEEHASLVKVLRLSIYVLLSLLLEQSFLMDTHIRLHFPKHVHTTPFPTRPAILQQTSSTGSRPKIRDSFLSTSIWSMLTKKTGSFLHRTAGLAPIAHRAGSMDLPRPPPPTPSVPTPADDMLPTRQRRFSFFGESRASPTPASPPRVEEPFFQSALRQMEDSRTHLSTSIGVSLPTPALISRLADKERRNPTRKITGEERTGLSSILGWEGKKSRGAGMIGTSGFVRQQRLSVLYSEHIPKASRRPSIASEIAVATSQDDPNARITCGPRARFRTYVYYSTDDLSLGDMVTDMCGRADEPCSYPGCPVLRGQHELQWLHDGIQIQAKVVPSDDTSGDDVLMWEACSECGETTRRSSMSDGAYLFSFAKFLELLLYSPTICILAPPLCPHTTPPPRPRTGLDSPLPQSRFHIVRRFLFQSHIVSFSLSPIEDIFELRVPRLQIARGSWHERVTSEGSREVTVVGRQELEGGRDKRALRKEIKQWWQAVAEHLDKLESLFVEDDSPSHSKSLPCLPSTDQEWEDDAPSTPKASIVALPSTTPGSPTKLDRSISTASSATAIPLPRSQSMPPSESTSSSVKSISEVAKNADPMSLLSNMRFAFQKTEQELYSQLAAASETSLNDVRRLFHSAGVGAKRRLFAWEAKHISKEARQDLAQDREALQGPGWWGETFHAVPGSNIIIREGDWGSIIAFTLSSLDYQRELANMSRPTTERQEPSNTPMYPTLTTLSTVSPALSTASESSFKFFSKSTPKLDPDNEETVWHEPETCSAIITRKEHPRDPTALLSLREVLRHRVPEGSTGLPTFNVAGVSRIVSGTPPSAWAKPAVELNTHAADGQVTGMAEVEAGEMMGKILHEMDASVASSSATHKVPSEAPSSGFLETNIQRRKTRSILGAENSGEDSDSTTTGIDPDASPPIPFPKDSVLTTSGANQTTSGADPQSSAFSWSSLTHAMRYMMKPTDASSRPMSPILKNNANHHGLLSADPLSIDARPHIKYDWTIGKRLKFSCTVYYARQFDALRRQCGIEDVFETSMARSENWSADGGKSRSNFWKTADERFIIKTLVNAWNVADLQVLIELAPSYFRHMEGTANRASVLAKLLGFYTVEIRNLETGAVQSKADLLVMENLFYGQNVSKTFDLKGIQGRKVKATSDQSPSKTLFDGEWIEGQERALTLVHPHSKVVLREGLRSDCDFLAKSNIMDYSLLLGINEGEKEISCGLVDTIGSYTFAKTLEYKAKQGFAGKDGKQVTVMPPNEYQERFVTALDGYFLACPDKWTKPPEDKKTSYDYTELPSVL